MFERKYELYGHPLSSYEEKTWLQFNYTCFIKVKKALWIFVSL